MNLIPKIICEKKISEIVYTNIWIWTIIQQIDDLTLMVTEIFRQSDFMTEFYNLLICSSRFYNIEPRLC
jgi:hypothetical protein